MLRLFRLHLLVGSILCGVVSPAAATNFILILSDDQGWGTMSFEYDPEVPDSKSDFYQTPNVEKLARLGMRFTNAYSAHPNCSSSRASIQTGRSPAALRFTETADRSLEKHKKCQNEPLAGVYCEKIKDLKKRIKKLETLFIGNRLVPPAHIADLPLNDITIPELLKRHNQSYRAAHFGKWHLSGGGPSQHGYDASDGDTKNGPGSSEKNLPHNPKKMFEITKRSIKWIEAQVFDEKPFFLQLSHYAVHALSQSRPSTEKKFKNLSTGRRHRNAAFGSMLFDMDTTIAMLLDTVKKLDIANSTYIFFTSDNGTYRIGDSGNTNGPLRGFKSELWEGGLRVPFIAVGPGIEPNSINSSPVIGWDFLPTIGDLAGTSDLPESIEGVSLRPTLLSKNKQVVRPRGELIFHYPHYLHPARSGELRKRQLDVVPRSAILSDRWKLHYWWEDDRVALFDMKSAPLEVDDVSADNPEITRKLFARLMAHLDRVDAQKPLPNLDYDPLTDPRVNPLIRN